jgi:two-component system chemotaxis sensor kinase CheA
VENEFSQDPALIQEFLVESEELLQRMDQDMIALEANPADTELLNRIFRALHTIKGTSGFLGFEPVVRLSHRAEDVLNALRRGDLQLSKGTTNVLLAARDQLGRMLSDIRGGGLKTYAIESLLGELEACCHPAAPAPKLGEMLAAKRVIQPEALNEALKTPVSSSGAEKIGEVRVEKALASAADVGSALVEQNKVSESGAGSPSMRVDVRKLDELINLIGELVLERNRLMQLSREFSAGRIAGEALDAAFSQSSARLSFITDELQTAGLKTRMMPIDAVFRKFPRMVRDLAQNLKKEVQLEVRGQETEINKTMVELIGDPLVHLVRNSLDHGIETPERRVRLGKAQQGRICLLAKQEGDQIVISVSDDGSGIDAERVLRKAIEKSLVTPERGRQLSHREILDFVFLPGFSTAENVSDVSGRGVGMDVVRTNLKRMNGTIQLDSVPGKGTTVLLHLPLTLAILPVLLVQVSNEAYGLPLRAVLETSRVRSGEVHEVEGNEVFRLHGQTLPLLRLNRLFAVPANTESREEKIVILLVGEKRIALMVDRLIGQESTVIKSLGNSLHHSSSVAGATIGGDGRVRLVLDPAGLLASVEPRLPEQMLQ